MKKNKEYMHSSCGGVYCTGPGPDHLNEKTSKTLNVKNRIENPYNAIYNSNLNKQGNTMIEAKIVLLGDSGVGKSCIAQRFWKNIFPD